MFSAISIIVEQQRLLPDTSQLLFVVVVTFIGRNFLESNPDLPSLISSRLATDIPIAGGLSAFPCIGLASFCHIPQCTPVHGNLKNV